MWAPAAAAAGGVRVLVTTRQRDLGGSVFTHFDTDLLDENAARTLLNTISGRRFADDAELRALLTHLQGHALSLQIAGATLRGFPEMSPETRCRRSPSTSPSTRCCSWTP